MKVAAKIWAEFLKLIEAVWIETKSAVAIIALIVIGAIPLLLVAKIITLILPTHQEAEVKRSLCREAAACKKYSEVRLECATAGSFKTCLRIKMGSDVNYNGMCSGYEDGAPAIPLSPQAPNAVSCFFLMIGQ